MNQWSLYTQDNNNSVLRVYNLQTLKLINEQTQVKFTRLEVFKRI